jgi:hypothetical protein
MLKLIWVIDLSGKWGFYLGVFDYPKFWVYLIPNGMYRQKVVS